MSGDVMHELAFELDEAARARLADRLEDTPQTATTLHVLRTGEGRAVGLGADARAALVFWEDLPKEADAAYGAAEDIVHLLGSEAGWNAVCVDRDIAAAVATGFEQDLGVPADRMVAEFYVLNEEPSEPRQPMIRELTSQDLGLLAPSAKELGIAAPERMLKSRTMAGAILDGTVVSLAQWTASSPRYADIGVSTLPAHRRRGFAADCARVVARRIFATGRRPIWSTGENNVASQRTAQSVGFEPAGQREYVLRRDTDKSDPRPA